MSQNYKASYAAATAARDINNNSLYHGGTGQGFGGRSYGPPSVTTGHKATQMSAKVLFGGVQSTINDLTKRQDKTEREVRRTH